MATATQDGANSANNALKNIRTRALVVAEPKADFTMQTVIYDEVREDEYLIEMKYSGICHTDIVLQQGLLEGVCEYPAIFGHEGAGIVRGLQCSRQVNPMSSGHPAYCWNFTDCNHSARRYSDKKSASTLEDGSRVGSMYFGHSSFSKLSVVKDQSVVKYPGTDIENMGLYAAAGCGFQTGAGSILNIFKLLENKRYHGLIEGDSNPAQFVPELINMHKAGKFPLDKLVTVYPVANLAQALDDMHAGKCIKAVIEWDD